MKIPVALFLAASLSAGLFSCGSPSSHDGSTDSSQADKPAAGSPAAKNPEFRKTVKKEAIATYREKTDDPLNDWYFTVKLYETPKTLQYLLTMQFEEVKGQDTLDLPDFGVAPQPILQKGKDKYSCIVGFLDNQNKFREYKRVYVKDGNNLKLMTLRHYSVTGQPE
ncbi:MAG: hypothetical protein P4L51_27380 [Puia sp.]|nr:hypothetical protein [Puia sp.]